MGTKRKGGVQWAGTYSRLPVGILRDTKLSDTAKLVMLTLRYYARSGTDCWPTQATMAADLGKSERTIIRALKELSEHGLVQVSKRREGIQEFNRYTLLDYTVADAEAVVGDRRNTSPTTPTGCHGRHREVDAGELDAKELDTPSVLRTDGGDSSLVIPLTAPASAVSSRIESTVQTTAAELPAPEHRKGNFPAKCAAAWEPLGAVHPGRMGRVMKGVVRVLGGDEDEAYRRLCWYVERGLEKGGAFHSPENFASTCKMVHPPAGWMPGGGRVGQEERKAKALTSVMDQLKQEGWKNARRNVA